MERVPESCADVLSNLPLYVGADLDPEVQAAVDRHLQACSACRVAADRVQASRQVLWSEFAETEVPADLNLWSSLRPQLADEGLFDGIPARRSMPLWRVASYAAAAALLFSITVLQFTGPGSPEVIPDGDMIASPSGPTIPVNVAENNGGARPAFGLRKAREGEEAYYMEARSFDFQEPLPLHPHVHRGMTTVTGQSKAEVVIFAPRK